MAHITADAFESRLGDSFMIPEEVRGLRDEFRKRNPPGLFQNWSIDEAGTLTIELPATMPTSEHYRVARMAVLPIRQDYGLYGKKIRLPSLLGAFWIYRLLPKSWRHKELNAEHMHTRFEILLRYYVPGYNNACLYREALGFRNGAVRLRFSGHETILYAGQFSDQSGPTLATIGTEDREYALIHCQTNAIGVVDVYFYDECKKLHDPFARLWDIPSGKTRKALIDVFAKVIAIRK